MKSFMVFSFWFIITTMIGFTGCDRTSQSCPSKTDSPQSASMAMLWNTLKKPKAQYSQNLFQFATSIPANELVPFLKEKIQAEWKEVIDPPIVSIEPVAFQKTIRNDPGFLILKTYDVSDIIMGQSTFTTVIPQPPISESVPIIPQENTSQAIEELIQVIKEVFPGDWNDPQRSVEPWQSTHLLIRQTPKVHEKINNLFGVIRENNSKEKRFGPCTCVLLILDRIGTPDAMAIVKEIGKKHSDPYIGDLAKNLLKNHGKKRPAFFGP